MPRTIPQRLPSDRLWSPPGAPRILPAPPTDGWFDKSVERSGNVKRLRIGRHDQRNQPPFGHRPILYLPLLFCAMDSDRAVCRALAATPSVVKSVMKRELCLQKRSEQGVGLLALGLIEPISNDGYSAAT